MKSRRIGQQRQNQKEKERTKQKKDISQNKSITRQLVKKENQVRALRFPWGGGGGGGGETSDIPNKHPSHKEVNLMWR